MIDALYDVAARDYRWAEGPLAAIPAGGRLVLITAHRRESFGPPFRELCLAIADLARMFAAEGVHFVYPVHLNPNVREPVTALLSHLPNVSLIEPLDYLSLVQLMKRSALVLTDSGGIQEEAPALQVPVLVMRETTERPEGLATGLVTLVGTDRDTHRLRGRTGAEGASGAAVRRTIQSARTAMARRRVESCPSCGTALPPGRPTQRAVRRRSSGPGRRRLSRSGGVVEGRGGGLEN